MQIKSVGLWKLTTHRSEGERASFPEKGFALAQVLRNQLLKQDQKRESFICGKRRAS